MRQRGSSSKPFKVVYGTFKGPWFVVVGVSQWLARCHSPILAWRSCSIVKFTIVTKTLRPDGDADKER